MEIRVSGHNIDVTQGMKQHLEERLAKYEKYAPRLVESHVVLKKQKYIFEAEITLLAKHLRAFGDGQSRENIFTAIDKASTKVEKQLIKYRAKLKDHHKKGLPAPILGSDPKTFGLRPLEGMGKVVKAGELRRPTIVASEAFAAKPMSMDEASMQLEILPESFLVFRNAQTKKVNVIYKMADGNHGLIEEGKF